MVITRRKITQFVHKLFGDLRGGLAVIASVAMMVIVLLVGVAYDYNGMTSVRSRLQDSVDLAALAGASIARTNEGQIERLARKTLEDNIAMIANLSLVEPPDITINNNAKEVTVLASARYNLMCGRMLSVDNMRISASSTSGFAIEQMNPFVVYLVLDVSGSMSWLSSDGSVKLSALQTAVTDMFYTLYSTSENPTLLTSTIRTGFSTYSTVLGPSLDIEQGYSQTVSQVNALSAAGGTNSTPGFQYAYDQIMDELNGTSNLVPYIIFMTDGDNNSPAFDVTTTALCDQAKADNITIFTVAFEAPAKGQALLQACATSPDKVYNSANAASLNAAFRDIGSEISQAVVRLKR